MRHRVPDGERAIGLGVCALDALVKVRPGTRRIRLQLAPNVLEAVGQIQLGAGGLAKDVAAVGLQDAAVDLDRVARAGKVGCEAAGGAEGEEQEGLHGWGWIRSSGGWVVGCFGSMLAGTGVPGRKARGLAVISRRHEVKSYVAYDLRVFLIFDSRPLLPVPEICKI